jgi:hypothetical protein
MDETPVRVFVHPLLLDEFQKLKEEVEEKAGRKIKGGIPIISKIIAMRLKNQRVTGKRKISVEFTKVVGENKIVLSL